MPCGSMPGGTQILKTALCALFLLGCAMIAGMPGQAVAQDAAGAVHAEHTGPRPGDAVITSKGWRCRDGFALAASGRCEAVKAPANAIVVGNSWSCNAGYRSNGKGQCARIVAPLNATVRGRGWTCNPGFTQTADGKSCRLVN